MLRVSPTHHQQQKPNKTHRQTQQNNWIKSQK
jgi:hypothetical protein